MKVSIPALIISISLCLSIYQTKAQNLPTIYPYLQAKVIDSTTKVIQNAFAGGFNTPQISPIDLNNDGIKDLFVFDKKNQQITTFLNGGTANKVDYHYAPKYANFFPDLKDWALLVDFDGDGLEDIFTHASAYVIVYKSYYENDLIQFNLVDTLFYENRNGFKLNVLVSPADLPAITDVNGDGDIDILTFDQLGIHIEYFENLQVEKNLPVDSLFFEKIDDCWGSFSENTNDAGINLNTPCKGGGGDIENTGESNKHQGSTITAFDYDGDQDKDILLGDIGSRFLSFLRNGGDTNHAEMVEVIHNFPAENNPFESFFFPAAFMLDVDNDCRADLIATHNTTSNAEDHNHIWWYKNDGDENGIQFNFKQRNFLLDNIIDVGTVAAPAVADINNDGKDDLLIGNRFYFNKSDTSVKARLAAYINISNEDEILFQQVSKDFANLSQYNMVGLYPAFGDVDLDGDTDMICSDDEGYFHFFRNEAAEGEWMNLQAAQLYIDSFKLDNRAIPFLYDYDEDGLLDIITGTKSGTLNYIKNIGNENEIHVELGQSFLGLVKETDLGSPIGYSAPYIHVIDESDKAYLLVHSRSGNIAIFDDLQAAEFTKIEANYGAIKTGGGGGIAVSDFNKDGLYEIIIGTESGGVQLFSQKQTEPVSITFNTQHCAKDTINAIELNEVAPIQIYPTIANDQLFVETTRNQKLSYKIFNVKGQLVLAGNLQAKAIELNNLPKGLFFLSITNNSMLRFFKK